MTKTEINEKAKEILMTSLAVAYYRLEEEVGISQKDLNAISEKIDKYAKSMAKAIGKKYYSL